MDSYLGKKVTIIMDRPLRSSHPKHGFIYPINYGYIPDTVAGDGEEVDAYVIEDKLVVCKQKDRYTKEQIEALVEFQERFFDSTIIME